MSVVNRDVIEKYDDEEDGLMLSGSDRFVDVNTGEVYSLEEVERRRRQKYQKPDNRPDVNPYYKENYSKPSSKNKDKDNVVNPYNGVLAKNSIASSAYYNPYQSAYKDASGDVSTKRKMGIIILDEVKEIPEMYDGLRLVLDCPILKSLLSQFDVPNYYLANGRGEYSDQFIIEFGVRGGGYAGEYNDETEMFIDVGNEDYRDFGSVTAEEIKKKSIIKTTVYVGTNWETKFDFARVYAHEITAHLVWFLRAGLTLRLNGPNAYLQVVNSAFRPFMEPGKPVDLRVNGFYMSLVQHAAEWRKYNAVYEKARIEILEKIKKASDQARFFRINYAGDAEKVESNPNLTHFGSPEFKLHFERYWR